MCALPPTSSLAPPPISEATAGRTADLGGAPWKLDTVCPSLADTPCPVSLHHSVQVPQASEP